MCCLRPDLEGPGLTIGNWTAHGALVSSGVQFSVFAIRACPCLREALTVDSYITRRCCRPVSIPYFSIGLDSWNVSNEFDEEDRVSQARSIAALQVDVWSLFCTQLGHREAGLERGSQHGDKTTLDHCWTCLPLDRLWSHAEVSEDDNSDNGKPGFKANNVSQQSKTSGRVRSQLRRTPQSWYELL